MNKEKNPLINIYNKVVEIVNNNNQNPNSEHKIQKTYVPPNNPQSEQGTKKQTQNYQNYQPPMSNNGWTQGEIKIDLYQKEYLIEKELGRGGFGITYLVTEMATKKEVVIKTIKEELRERPDFSLIKNSFINEAIKLRACQSPFIVSVYQVTEFDNKEAIIMEYIEGTNLQSIIEERGEISINEALKYILQIGEALKTVHGQNLLHRDIKADNIIIRKPTNEAVLIDFGLALQFNPDTIESNRLWLTPGYSPPEQHQLTAKWGFYTDVYALAATLYYSLTGEIPIPAPDRIRRQLPSPQSLNSKISNKLNEAIENGLITDPFNRPQTVEKWLQLLTYKPPISSYLFFLLEKFNKIIIFDNKRNIILISLGILGIIILLMLTPPLCNQGFLPSPLRAKICSVSEVKLKEYNSINYEFKLQYPETWKIEEIRKNALQPWQLKFYSEDGKEPIMVIFVEELNELYSLQEYWDEFINLILNNGLEGATVNSKNPTLIKLKIDIDGKKFDHSAYQINYTENKNGELIEAMEIVTVYNYRGYNILFKGDKNDYGQYKSIAEKLIKSFEFTIPKHLIN